MITQRIDPDEEFVNPNVNYDVLMKKLSSRIIDLESDIITISDPIVKGFALKELMSLREKYFDYLKVDMELQHMVLSNPEIYGEGEKNEDIQ